VSRQPAYLVFCFEGQKVPYPGSSFPPDIKLSWINLTTVNMGEWEVTRQSSVRVTPLLYLVGPLVMYISQTSAFGLVLGLAFRIRILC